MLIIWLVCPKEGLHVSFSSDTCYPRKDSSLHNTENTVILLGTTKQSAMLCSIGQHNSGYWYSRAYRAQLSNNKPHMKRQMVQWEFKTDTALSFSTRPTDEKYSDHLMLQLYTVIVPHSPVKVITNNLTALKQLLR